ncbi:MAG: hypothetical protein P9L92_13760 [Candidatus Electryonea clarkiae]|nr:hypothetical protein [Candidatus Electryonea clarkiae]MDP8287681.1 hypothetical protein [Candidatus Electryonea clarkiae]
MTIGSNLTLSNISPTTRSTSLSPSRSKSKTENEAGENQSSIQESNQVHSRQWSTASGHELYKKVQELYAEEGRSRLDNLPGDTEKAQAVGVGRSIDTFA